MAKGISGWWSSLLGRKGAAPGGQDERGASAAPRASPEGRWAVGQVVLGDFLIEAELGEGGMGVVYRVRSRSDGERFAVKRTRLQDDASRRNFLAELQTWIELPAHPQLVACRFFRTVGDAIVIFAEYVEGGSLEQWIRSGRLYEGGPRQALSRVLDAAVQLAWGLHAAHELGVVHQDVKPGNALMTPAGALKVTDFGLARARAAAGVQAPVEAGRSVLVSSCGMTPAYCSPEQARGERLTRRTDLWSWGVSVLELFTGEVTWMAGQAAAEALQHYAEVGPDDPRLPRMPAAVVAVLRRCFRVDPTERWPTLAEAADRLRAAYREALGEDYPRTAPAAVARGAPVAAHDRRLDAGGVQWRDPRDWLTRLLQAAGHDPAEADALLLPRAGSRKAQAIADLAAYEEAERLYDRLIASGRAELRPELAAFCIDKAFVHESTDDLPGALRMYDRAIETYERLVHQEGRRELAPDLATAYMNKANALWALGDLQGAVALCDRAIETDERLVHQEGRRELAPELATAYLNKANALQVLGDLRGAVALCDRAIEIRERLVHQEGRRELAPELATTYLNKANALWALGDLQGAVALYDRAIEIGERLVHQEGRRELAPELARAYMNKANALSDLGDLQGAVALYDRTIETDERLVHQEGRRELAPELARAYMNKAIALRDLGDLQGAVALNDRAIETNERLVHQEGRRELAPDLARTYLNKAHALRALGDLQGAVALYDRTIEAYERLVHQEGRQELAPELATAYLNKANALQVLGDLRGAVALYDRAIEIRERLVHQEGHRELAGDLAWARAARAASLLALGEAEKAAAEAREAVAILRAEVQRTGRADLQRVLKGVEQIFQNVL